MANGAAPVLTTNNSASSNEFATIVPSTAINFRATADQTVTYVWLVNDVNQNNPYSNLTATWATAGSRVVRVTATNTTNGATSYTWVVVVRAVKAVSTVTPINISSYTNLRAEFDASPDIIRIVKVDISTYTNSGLGEAFYLFLWGLIFVMMWLNQGKVTLPAVLGLILGAAVLAMLPAEYQLVGQAMVVMGFFAVIYVFFRDRR